MKHNESWSLPHTLFALMLKVPAMFIMTQGNSSFYFGAVQHLFNF